MSCFKFLKKWLSVFPREQVLILSSEKFYENPAETVQQVFQFLGLPDYVLPAYQKYNSRSYPEVDESIQHRPDWGNQDLPLRPGHRALQGQPHPAQGFRHCQCGRAPLSAGMAWR